MVCLKADVEEHSAGVRILERAAVAVQPRGEDNSAAACGGLVYNMRHVVVKAREYGLLRGGDIGLLEEYVNFIEGKVILDPLEAFTGGLKLREGSVEVNCTVDTLLALSRNSLDAEIAAILFD